jgi:glycosyltransferase involved in cell wall biosynthesis
VQAEHTGNLSYVRNLGLGAAKAPWLAFLDADDIWLPSKLERQLEFHATHPHLRWSYTGRSLIDASGAPLPGSFPWQPVDGWILLKLLVHQASIASPSMMIERSLLTETGGFDERFPYAGDYDLQLRLAVHAECGVVAEPLVKIRRHDACRTLRQPDAVNAMARVYRKFSRNAPSREALSLARRQEALCLNREARMRFEVGQWSHGWQALGAAIRARPLDTRAYRLTVRGMIRMGQGLLGR